MVLPHRLTASDVESLFTAIFSGPQDVCLSTIQQWFSPSYIQVTDGHRSTFDEFVAHITKLRSLVRSVNVECLFLVQEQSEDGKRVKVADRHVVRLEKVDGSTAALEVLLMGERDEMGRFVRVWENSRTLEGGEGDRELARVK